MLKITLVQLLLLFTLSMLALEPHFMTDPDISPDGQTVCFVYQGDLWSVPFEGGIATRLTATPASEWGPAYSPDGKLIAFNSDREGRSYIYTIPSHGGSAISLFHQSFSVSDWFNDSKSLLVASYQIGKGESYCRLSLDGSRPVEITNVGDFYGSLNSDDSKIIFNRRGYPFRESYQGSVNGELWEYDISAKTYSKLTNTNITERYPVCSKNADNIYYARSDGTLFQLVRVKDHDFTNPEVLSEFTKWSSRDLSIASNSDKLVFEYFDEIWRYDPSKLMGDRIEKIDVQIPEDIWQNEVVREDVTNHFESFAVSQDQKWIAFSYKYDLFAVPVKGGEVKQITHDLRSIKDIAILPDNRTILFSGYEHGEYKLFTVNIEDTANIMLVPWSKDKYIESIQYAPNHQFIIVYSKDVDHGRIAIADSTGTVIREVLTDEVCSSNFALSDDGKYGLYVNTRPGIWTNRLILMNMSDMKKRTILSDDNSIRDIVWGKGGKSIFFSRSNEICRLDLVPRNDFDWDKDQWKEIFTTTEKDTLKKEKKTSQIEFNWNMIDKRITSIVKRPNWCNILANPDDSTLYFISWDDKKPSIIKINYNGKSEEEIASLEAHIDNDQYLIDKMAYYYVSGNSLKSINLKTRKKETYSNSFKYQYNKMALNKEVFKQAWGEFGRNFYDSQFHGKDWVSFYNKFLPYMDYAYSANLMGNIIEEMIGDLNASHTGFRPREENEVPSIPQAYIGANFDYRQNLNRGIAFRNVYRESILSELYNIKDGDILLSVNGQQIGKNSPIDSLFYDKIGQRIQLKILHEGVSIDAEVKGLTWGENYKLYYDNDKAQKKNLVTKNTNGRIGYVHIQAMSGTDYTQFVEDLFANNFDKDGLILDIRGNSGGNIHDKLIELLTKKVYAFSTNKYYNAKYPTPTSTFQKPIVLLIDEESVSDGEIFPILFSELKLGKIVGMPTSGSVIGTVEYTLKDGSQMRLPTSGWYRLDGTNMEGTGAKPDIQVDNTPDDEVNDNDRQLLKAIDIIEEEIPPVK